MIHTQVGKRFMGCEDRSAHKTRRKRSSRASVIVFCHTIVNLTIVSAHPEERERKVYFFTWNHFPSASFVVVFVKLFSCVSRYERGEKNLRRNTFLSERKVNVIIVIMISWERKSSARVEASRFQSFSDDQKLDWGESRCDGKSSPGDNWDGSCRLVSACKNR
jgi:hypothetical protein